MAASVFLQRLWLAGVVNELSTDSFPRGVIDLLQRLVDLRQ